MKAKNIFTIVALLLVLIACGSPNNMNENTPIVDNPIGDTNKGINEEKEDIVTYYDRNSDINLYLNRFNSSNPDYVIDSNLFEVYYHHGSEHDNQIIFYRDGFKVVISDILWGNDNEIKLVIQCDEYKTIEDYKALFLQYAKAFSIELTDEKLETYWGAVLDDIIYSSKFDEFECSLNKYGDIIEWMTIEGKIS